MGKKRSGTAVLVPCQRVVVWEVVNNDRPLYEAELLLMQLVPVGKVFVSFIELTLLLTIPAPVSPADTPGS